MEKAKVIFKWLYKLGLPIVSGVMLIVFIVYGNKWFAKPYMFLIPTIIGALFGLSCLGGIVNWFRHKFGTIKHEVKIVNVDKSEKQPKENNEKETAIAEVIKDTK